MQSSLPLPRQPLQCTTPRICRRRAAVVCEIAKDKQSLREIARRCASAGLAACISLSTLFGVSSTNNNVFLGRRAAQATEELSQTATVEQRYVQQVQHRRPRSHLPSSDEQASLQLLVDRDLFTDDAWQGMIK